MRRIPLLKILLFLIGLHSMILGISQWFFTNLLIKTFGLSILLGPGFFSKQSGVFLLILGIGYLIAASNPKRFPGLVWLVVISKALAVVFLFSQYFLYGAPSIIIFVGLSDGAMGLAVVIVKRYEGLMEREAA